MAFKIAFFDIDNTLYDWKNRHFVDSGIEAIKRLNKKGVYVMACTARPYHSMKHFGIFNLGIHFDGFIASAGALGVFHNKTVYRQLMDPKIMRKLCKSVLEKGLTAEVITPRNRFMIAPKNEYQERYYTVFTDVTPEVHPYHGDPSTGMLLFAPAEYDDYFLSNFPSLGFYRFDTCGVDIMPGPRSKGDVMNKILAYLGLTKEEAIAFGDDMQDISMKEAAYFVCMGNGKPEVKEIADEVTANIAENGLALAIQKHFGA